LYAVPYANFTVFYSTNAGALWLAGTNGLADLTSVATSANGMILVAADNNGRVAVSTNGGARWTTNTVLGPGNLSVSASATGMRLLVASPGGGVFSSTNLGLTWVRNILAPLTDWDRVVCSADGSRLAVSSLTGRIWTSTDSGMDWGSNNAPSLSWHSLASSADGNILYAAAVNGGIWMRRTMFHPLLSISGSPPGAMLSWVIPSSPLVMQCSPDLGSTNWSSLTDAPTPEFATLRNRVTVPVSPSNSFFRLKGQ
jgi:hypothetical protein